MIFSGGALAQINGGAAGVAAPLTPAPFTAYMTGTVPIDTTTYTEDCLLDIRNADNVSIYRHNPRMRGRGNSTWAAPKKPYKVRSRDRQQMPFRLPKSRDWALMADYYDQSNLRSTVAFEVARRATGRWAPHSRHVRLIWNGDYQGLYRYSETVDVQFARIDIRVMSNSDTTGNVLTGPYMLEVNNPLEDPGFTTAEGTPVMYDVPDVLGVAAQETYIQAWTNTLENALIYGVEADFLPLIDVPSWADAYLLGESMWGQDTGWHRSCRWIKDQDAPNGTGKAILWAPWDYDLSLGLNLTNGALSSTPTTGWWTRTGPNASHGSHPNWYWWAWEKSPVFRAAVREAWATRFLPTINSIGPFLDAQHAAISDLITEDRAEWHLGAALPEMHTAEWMKTWLSTRTAWITANL